MARGFGAERGTTAVAAADRSGARRGEPTSDGPAKAKAARLGGRPAALDTRRAPRRPALILRPLHHRDRAADRGDLLRALTDRYAAAGTGGRAPDGAGLRARRHRFLRVRGRDGGPLRAGRDRNVRALLPRRRVRALPRDWAVAAATLRR